MFTVKKLGAEDNSTDYSPYLPDPVLETNNPFVLRIKCWNDTEALCEQLAYRPPPSVKVVSEVRMLYEMVQRRNQMKMNGQWSPVTQVDFLNQDAIDVALDLLATKRALRPLVLNLSDDCWAGGCVEQGSGAQEESLFRRTNYHQTLVQDPALYPILDGEAVYSPEVTILKSSEESGWQLYPVDQRPVLAFVACPAIKYPELVEDEYGGSSEPRLKEEDVSRLKVKIGVIIETAARYRHDAIVLGAMGCGAWRNPAKHVAEIFKSVLDTYEGMVPYVVFAILSTSDDKYIVRQRNREGTGRISTCEIFEDVFSK